MRHKLREAPGKPVAREECRHHWIIESHRGPISRGVCKLCGAVREFRNYVQYTVWGGAVSKIPEPPDLTDNESMKARAGS